MPYPIERGARLLRRPCGNRIGLRLETSTVERHEAEAGAQLEVFFDTAAGEELFEVAPASVLEGALRGATGHQRVVALISRGSTEAAGTSRGARTLF